LEVKVPQTLQEIKLGIKEIEYYMKMFNVKKGILVIFDARKNKTQLDNLIHNNIGEVDIFQYDVYPEPPTLTKLIK
jgi:hypothetical protein